MRLFVSFVTLQESYREAEHLDTSASISLSHDVRLWHFLHVCFYWNIPVVLCGVLGPCLHRQCMPGGCDKATPGE